MILTLDTTKNECEVSISKNKNIDSLKWQWQKDTGTELLENIEKLLKKNKKELKDIEKILVNVGLGSFTGTRVGVTVANTLAWSLNIPVFGYRDGELEAKLKRIKNSKTRNFKKIVLPYYK